MAITKATPMVHKYCLVLDLTLLLMFFAILRIRTGEHLSLAGDYLFRPSAKAETLLWTSLSNSLLSIILIGRFEGLVYRGLREIVGWHLTRIPLTFCTDKGCSTSGSF